MAPTVAKPKVIANAMSIKLNILRSISVMQKCVTRPSFPSHSPWKERHPSGKGGKVRKEERTDKAIQYKKHPVK